MEISVGVVGANEAETTRIVENGHPFRLIRPDDNGAARDQLGELMVQVRANGAAPVPIGKTDGAGKGEVAQRVTNWEN